MKGIIAKLFSVFAPILSKARVNLAVQAVVLLVVLAGSVFAQAPATAARIDAATYQRVVDENLDLRKEQARLEGDVAALRRKNAALLVDIQDLERRRDQLTALVAQLKTPEELAAQMARLQAEKTVLVHEIERVRQSLLDNAVPVTNTRPLVVTAAPAAGSDLFRKLEQENSELRQEVAKARETIMTESVAKELAQKSEAALKAEVDQLSAQYKTTAAELDAFQRREAGLKKAAELQSKKAFESEAALKKGQELHSAKVKDLEAALQKAGERQARKETEIEVANQKGRELEATVAQLEGQVSALKKAAEKQVSDLGSIPSLLAAAQKQIQAGRVLEAEKQYLLALKRDEKNPLISYNLGVLYADYLKEPAKAVKYFRNYLALAPKADDANVVRSWLIDLTARTK